MYLCVFICKEQRLHSCACDHMRTENCDSIMGEEKTNSSSQEQSVPSQHRSPGNSHLWPQDSRCWHWQVQMAGMHDIAGDPLPAGCSRIMPASTTSHLMHVSPRGFPGGWDQQVLLPSPLSEPREMRSPPLTVGVGILHQLPWRICGSSDLLHHGDG